MLVHTGTLSGGRDAEPLFQALQLVQAEAGSRRFRLVHAGSLTTEERSLVARTGVQDLFEHVGVLPRARALALQRQADALVLLTSRRSSEATSKVYEYMASGRPILALAQNNEAERIVRETNTGLTVPPDDIGAIADALRKVAAGEFRRVYAPHDTERFSYPGPAEAMAEVVEDAIRLKTDKTRQLF
jgi:glycosyltransferase involved in cell wall biosynthesis